MQRKVGFPHSLLAHIHLIESKSNADGSYDMAYRANDPLVMSNVKDIEKRGGFLGMKKEKYTDNRNVYNGWSNSSWWAS